MIVIALYTLNVAHPGFLLSHILSNETGGDIERRPAVPNEPESGANEQVANKAE